MSGAWSAGSSRGWRRVRAFVLQRDGYRCRAHADGWCDRVQPPRPHTCTVRAEETGAHAGHAHHTRGRAVTGDDPRFVVAACAPCNRYIGDPNASDPQPTPRTRW